MKRFLTILILSLMLFGCNGISKEKSVYEIMAENEYIIIDVRTEEEYEESHLKEAINIPYDEIDKNIDLDKEKIIFVYCKSGNRSNIAFNNLTNLGYTVYDLGSFSSIDLPKEQ